MCGIFGVLAHDPSATRPDRAQLGATATLLEHRGPDDCAVFADHRVGLVHTRLALVDLDPRSNQPFWDRDCRYALIFNGEIYNFRELRSELEADGVTFRTTSDTEVLLEAILRHGVDAVLLRLEGMFAFAMYDSHEGSLTLARDRFGIKPLYVHDRDDVFIFGSEVQAFRPWVRFEPDLLSISSYLQGFGGPTSGRTFLQDVSIVPPGTVIDVQQGSKARYRRFWKMPHFWDPAEAERLSAMNPRNVVDLVEQRLFESVRMQLLADAPVGVLCSGGLDSSLITAMAARVHSNVAIFHADVEGPMSEINAATSVAKHLKLDLKAVKVRAQDSVDMLADVLLHYGHPFTYHPNSIPFLLVSRLIQSNHVKAILSGEGADECYIGYPWLIFDVRKFVLEAANLGAVYRTLRRGFRRALQRHDVDGRDGNTVALVRGLHNRFELEQDLAEIRTELALKCGCAPTAMQMVTLSQLGYHLRTLLHRNDCLGMAASIEARFPFLDSSLVRLAVNIPYRMKVRFTPTATDDPGHYFLRDKWILRKVAERYLPRALAHQKKRGFPIEAQNHLRITAEIFRNSFVADLFGLSHSDLELLIDEANQDLRLKLLQLEVWARIFLCGVRTDDVSAWLRERVPID
jgi:asparagine synthase (glutamine-hydrolysing)